MRISIYDSQRPVTWSKVSQQQGALLCSGVEAKLFTCPYALKVQSWPLWDQRPASLTSVSAQCYALVVCLHLEILYLIA